MSADEPWFVAAFGPDYPAVYAHRDLAEARAEVRALLEMGVRGRVLDLCCGFGRHTLALLEQGVDAFGADISESLLEASRDLEGSQRLRGRLARADARRLPFAARVYDAAVLLFSSFGYFGDDGDREVLRELARVLRPGGRAVLDLMNPPRVRAELVPASESERGGVRIRERRRLTDGGRRVVKDVLLSFVDGRERSWREDVRMYEASELRALLADAGLSLERIAGGFGGEASGPHAPRQIVLARAP